MFNDFARPFRFLTGLVVGVEATGTAVMVSRMDPKISLKLRENIRLSLNPEHLYFLNRNSEEAIV